MIMELIRDELSDAESDLTRPEPEAQPLPWR